MKILMSEADIELAEYIEWLEQAYICEEEIHQAIILHMGRGQ